MGNSARIVHLALKVADLERATRFYEQVFGFRQTGTGHTRGHVSRHMTDGAFDLALMVYDGEDEPEAQLSGPGPCIHHFGIEVANRDAVAANIVTHGGKIISDPNEGALKFRAPNGVVAEITRPGRYRKAQISGARISGLAIAASDTAAAADFYKTVFGFNEAASNATTRDLTDGSFRIRFLSSPLGGRRRRESPEAISSRSGGAPRDEVAPMALRVRGESRHHHWTVEVADAASVARAIEQHGGKSEGPNLYRTPDGSLLEITAG